MRRWRLLAAVLVGFAVLLAAACAEKPRRESAVRAPAAAQAPQLPQAAPAPQPAPAGPVEPVSDRASLAPKIAEIYTGSGRRIDPDAARPTPPRPRGDITLNFSDTDIREVVAVVLRDLLGLNFVIDPAVRGTVTVQTGRPLSRADLLPTLEAILEASGAALVRIGGVYRVTADPQAARLGDISVGNEAGGAHIAVYPLSYIGAEAMAEIVAPLLPEGRLLRADGERALLVVAGTSREHKLVGDTIDIFDVDQLAGATVLLESAQNVDVNTLAFELEGVFGDLTKGPLAGAIRIIPIERMNALLVIAKQPRYIDEARNWIARLDRTRNTGGRRLFVYYAQNGKARDLAATLQGIFQPEGGGQAAITGVRLASPGADGTDQASPPAEGARPAGAGVTAGGEGGGVRIMADEPNNAVLVLATEQEYRIVEEVLSKLDIEPLQVLIEASIFEVTLRDQLRFGVQFFIKSGGLDITDAGSTVLSSGANSLISPNFPGFVFTLADNNQARLIIDTLTQITDVNMLSSPQVMVLDNQPARLHVGDQVPIVTQISTSTLTSDPRIVNAVEYRDTGVTLEVTPRVNASGLVTLEIAQEVSDVTATTTSTINSPTIQQRQILSTVAVRSGQTIGLGGLIRASSNDSRSGLPVLSDLPVIGPLFGTSSADLRRTELLVILTPTVVRNEREANDATAEMRRRYQAIVDLQARGVRYPRRYGDTLFE